MSLISRRGVTALVRSGRTSLLQRSLSTGSQSHRPPEGGGNERLWAVGALTLTIPALVWIYNKHQKSHSKNLGSNSPAVLISDLRELQDEFANPPPPAEMNDASTGSAGDGTADSTAPSTPLPASQSVMNAKYVLIGGGSASFAALEEIRRLEPLADVLIISEEPYPPYMRPPLSKELWFSPDGAATKALRFTDWHGKEKPIFYQQLDFFETERLGRPQGGKPRLLLGRRATSIDIESKSVTLDNGQTVVFDKLLIATGGQPKQLPLLQAAPAEVKQRCSTFRGIRDLHHLLDTLEPSSRVAIVGGGFLGSELAVALAQYGRTHLGTPGGGEGSLQITQMFPEEGNMALVFPRYLSKWTMSKVRKAGVNVLPRTTVSNISLSATGGGGAGDRPLLLHLSNGKQVEADHLLVAIGIEPNTQLAAAAGLELDGERGGIMTNSQLQVCKDVYAAGDVISFHDPSLGLRRRVEHYDHAILSGRTAAANMVNANSRKYCVQSMFWSDLGPEIGYEAVGLVDAQLTTVGVWAEAAPTDSPRAADLDPSDIRVQSVGSVSSRVSEPEAPTAIDKLKSVIPSPAGEKSYGKGVVFYVQDRHIVGVLMFNLFNRLELARDVIRKRTPVEELETIVGLFNINGGDSSS